MTGTARCREIRQALGIYVLGAIDPAERSLVDEHLAGCPDCRADLAGLAGLPALLRRVPATEAQRLALGQSGPWAERPPEEMLSALLWRVAQVRRARRRRNLVAVAAAVAVAVGVGIAGSAVVHAGNGGGPAPSTAQGATWLTATAGNERTGASMTVRYSGTSWGTAMDVEVTGIPRGTVCKFQVVGPDGRASVAGGWQVGYRSTGTWYPVSSSLQAASVRAFQLASGGKVLVSVPVR